MTLVLEIAGGIVLGGILLALLSVLAPVLVVGSVGVLALLDQRRKRKLAPAVSDAEPHITCPVCGYTSYNENDILHGWCGHCSKQTSPHKGAQWINS